MNVTKFVGRVNPFTGEDVVKLVPIPVVCGRSIKGKTAHDEKFEKLLEFKQALQIPDDEFQAVRKALHRFMENKGLTKVHAVRQYKDHRTKSYSLWLVETPPIPRPRPKKVKK